MTKDMKELIVLLGVTLIILFLCWFTLTPKKEVKNKFNVELDKNYATINKVYWWEGHPEYVYSKIKIRLTNHRSFEEHTWGYVIGYNKSGQSVGEDGIYIKNFKRGESREIVLEIHHNCTSVYTDGFYYRELAYKDNIAKIKVFYMKDILDEEILIGTIRF
jgi:hypothetical protein